MTSSTNRGRAAQCVRKKKLAPPARHKSAYGPLKTKKTFFYPHFLLHQYTALIEYSIFALHFSCWFALHQPL